MRASTTALRRSRAKSIRGHQWWHAYDVASRVRGVKAVINNITVSEANNANGTNWKRDADLVKTIKSRLRSELDDMVGS